MKQDELFPEARKLPLPRAEQTAELKRIRDWLQAKLDKDRKERQKKFYGKI